MRRIAILVLGAAAFAAGTVDIAAARDGCGRGMYFNGYRCAPMGYGHPGYGPPVVRHYGYGYREHYGYRRPDPGPYLGPGPGWHRPHMTTGGPGCSHPRYTIQDGICKPYRGY